MSTAPNRLKQFTLAGALAAILALGNQSRAQSTSQAGYLYLSPVPGASYVSAQTRYVLVRFTQIDPSAVTNLTSGFISVSGAQSGAHLGTTHVASDGRTVIFETGTDFAPNELATVTLNPGVAPSASSLVQPLRYEFMVTGPFPGSLPLTVLPLSSVPQSTQVAKPKTPNAQIRRTTPTSKITPKAMLMPNGVSVPNDFPQVVITVNSNASPGYLFLENALDGVSPYTMMLDNSGLPVWYQQGRMWDFKVQKNGMITFGGYDTSGNVIFSEVDQNFTPIRTYSATNGYLTDVHDLKILPDGSYFLLGDRMNIVDMSKYVANGEIEQVMESVVQGFTAADELILQWRAWDNYDIRDLWPPGISDFPHMNGVDIDDDGNIVVSARHLSEVTKFDRDSGAIIWRLSGAHSSFTFTNDSLNGTSYQHNISALGNNHYMVFDNGDYHDPQVSRAIEYALDLKSMVATPAWQFRDTPDKYAWYCGSAQRLTNGNTFIDFVIAGYPKATEVDTNGVKQFELSLLPSSDSYRAFRFPWNGVVAAPYLIVEPQPDNITLVFNKFGDKGVAYYRIYGGTTPHPTSILAESTTTLKQLSNLPNGFYYFRVTAVNSLGVESPFSNEENINVNFPQPGANTVQNGNFSLGESNWTLTTNGAATAAWAVLTNTAMIYVTNGGVSLSGVRLVQANQPLLQGNKYVLQFDAWSDQSRYIGVQLVQNQSPFTSYTQINSTLLTPNPTHYQYVFTMQQVSDFSANLVFNLGSLGSSIFIENVSLFNSPPGDLNLDGNVNLLDLSSLVQAWLKQQSGAPADLNGDGKVDFNDLTVMGDNWKR